MKKNNICALLLGGALLSATTIVGCTSGGGSGSKGTDSIPSVVNRAHPVTISPMASIPLTGVNHEFSIRISNEDKDAYILDKIEVIDPLTGKSAGDKIVVNSASCNEKIVKGSYCNIQIRPLVTKSSAFILKATLSSGAKKEVVTQLIRISDKIRANNGVYFTNDVNEVMADVNGRYNVALPIILDRDFESINVTNGTLSCEAKTKGSACTYSLNGTINSDNTLVGANVKLLTNTTEQYQVKSDMLVRTNNPNYTHVLLSQAADIEANADGSYTQANVIAFNSGNQTANAVNIVTTQGFVATDSCDGTLGAGSQCVINVDLDPNSKDLSLVGSLKFNYTDALNTAKIAQANLFYNASILGVGLDIYDNGNDFLNTLVGTQKKITYTVKNTGAKALKGIKLRISDANLVIDNTSNNCSDLAPAATCQVMVAYAPQAAKDPSVASLAFSATYEENKDYKKTIYGEKGIPYSALEVATLFQLSPDFHSFVAKTNEPIGDSHVYRIKNISNYNSTLETPTINSTVLQDEFVIGDNLCNNKLLLPNQECELQAKFIPTNDYLDVDATITIPVQGFGGVAAPAIGLRALLNSSADALLNPNIQVTSSVEQFLNGINGQTFAQVGANNSSIDFAMFAGRMVRVKYTFKNDNTAGNVGTAQNFNVNVSDINPAFEVFQTETNCPTGIRVSPLLAGSSCDVVITIPKEKYFTSGMLYGQDFQNGLSLRYSYVNLDASALEITDSDPIDVKISTKFVDADTTTITSSVQEIAEGKYQVNLKVKLGNFLANPAQNAQQVAKVTASILGIPVQQSSTSTCSVVVNTLTDCNEIIQLPSNFPKGTHALEVTIAHADDASLQEKRMVEFTIN